MSKRGLSFDEKKQRTSAYMHEQRESGVSRRRESASRSAPPTIAFTAALQSGVADGEGGEGGG
jgi:hypothetical protein